MEITRKKTPSGVIATVSIGAGEPWLSSAAELDVSSIMQFVDSLYSAEGSEAPVAALILQTAPRSDATPKWRDEVRDALLVEELTERIIRFRGLLYMMIGAPVPIGYASASNCLGSTFELAAACSNRIWFNPDAMVGLPEYLAQVWPPGGTMERMLINDVRARERWTSEPILTARAAATSGLLDAATQVKDWQSVAASWFQGVVASISRERRTSGVRSRATLPSTARILLSETPAVAAFGRRNGPLYRPESRMKHGQLQYGPDYFWSLVKDRSKAATPQQHDALAAYGSAKAMLTLGNMSSLARQVTEDTVEHPVTSTLATLRSPVSIDLDHALPPTAALAALLEERLIVVFFAGSAKILSEGLETVFSRLDKELGSSRAAVLWERQVGWYIGSAREGSDLILRWTADDRVILRVSGVAHDFFALGGNHAAARRDWLEWTRGADENVSDLATEVGRIISKGLIPCQREVRSATFAAVQLRLILAAEIQALAADGGLTTRDMLELLRMDGWGVGAEELTWDRLARSRVPPDWRPSFAMRDLYREGVMSGIELLNRKSTKSTPRRGAPEANWTPESFGQHLAVWCGLATFLLAQSKTVSSLDAADLLVSATCGYPAKYLTPTQFLNVRGRARVEAIVATHWPKLTTLGLLDEIWSHADRVV